MARSACFITGDFESLYLRRDEYQIGTLPRYQALNIWFVNRIYLLPLWIIVCCVLPALWVLPQIEKRIRVRLEGGA